jgi:uncharacterized protein related to proFAR isomerase
VEPGQFQVVPRVFLRKRRLVRADGSAPGGDAVPRVRELASKGPVWVVDLHGLDRNRADLDTLRKLAEKGNVWVDGASRYATDAMDLLVAGAERVVLRWSALASEEELRESVALSDAIVLALEYDGAIVPHPTMDGEARALALARDLELDVAVLDQRRAGTRVGLDRPLASRLASSGLRRWFAGGVRDDADAHELEAMGYQGCCIDEVP